MFLMKISRKNSSLKNWTTPTKANIFFLKIRDRLTLNFSGNRLQWKLSFKKMSMLITE